MTSQLSTARLSLAGVFGVLAVLVGVLITMVPDEYVLGGVLLLAAALVIYRFPIPSLAALVVIGVGPSLFLMTGRDWAYTAGSLGRFSIADALITAMLFAVVLKTTASVANPRYRTGRLPVALAVCYGLLLAWAAVSILRNVDAYGIHTVGHFRYTYLIAVVPAYIAMFLRSPAQRRRFLVFLIVFSVGVPLAALPAVGLLKGWSVGPTSRFFPSSVSLGLLYGWTALLLACERGAIGVPKWLARWLALPVAAILLADSHRSVWLTGLILMLYFVAVGRVSAGVRSRLAALAAAIVTMILVAASVLRLDVLAYVVDRGSAIVDPGGDPTSSWRLGLWESNLARWWDHPLAGDGFGGYYAGNAELGVSVSLMPHSLYVETLVTMGAIGLALLVAVVVAAGATLWTALKQQRTTKRGSLDTTLVELGLGILISAQAYWSVYSFDYYSCLWVGVALAAAVGARHRAAEGKRGCLNSLGRDPSISNAPQHPTTPETAHAISQEPISSPVREG